MADQADVRRVAMSLPGVTETEETFSFRVAGKLFVWAYPERVGPGKRVLRPDVMAVRVADEWDKQALLALDEERFFTTPHYDGYPAVLVRLPHVDRDEVEDLVIGAWRARATRALLAQLQP